MMQRERAASGEAETVSRPPGSARAPNHPSMPPATLGHRAPLWEDLYRAIPPEQQRELLTLAERQGVLYAHQLPVTSNGTVVDEDHSLLARLLNGTVSELSPLHADPVDVGDSELDPVQREAVAKAMATPDILLVQGRPGSGKSRVVSEIITRAA